MKILVILAHPVRGSFNHAIAETALEVLMKNGHESIFRDLYREGFDPVLPGKEILEEAELDENINRHCEQLAGADGIIVIHPNWWGQPPAVMKGWIDRVFRPGVAYEFEEGDSGEGIPVGLLRAECALVFNTANTPRTRELEVFGDPLEKLWKTCIFDLCGIGNFRRRTFEVVVTSNLEQRKKWLWEVGKLVDSCFPARGVMS